MADLPNVVLTPRAQRVRAARTRAARGLRNVQQWLTNF